MIAFLINALKIIFLLVFLVLIHEVGHFVFAKLCKVKVNEFAIGLYSDYTEDKKGYCITVGNEVSNVDENNKDLDVKIIPAGKYAKFSICGNMVTAVAEAWQQIWDMDLDRSFTGDFEEYKNSEVENAEIDIYVALK